MHRQALAESAVVRGFELAGSGRAFKHPKLFFLAEATAHNSNHSKHSPRPKAQGQRRRLGPIGTLVATTKDCASLRHPLCYQ